MSQLDCLLAIPCFRESERLPAFLNPLCDALLASRRSVRLVVVDDGSGREEVAKLEATLWQTRERTGLPIELLKLPENRGKGFAIRSAWAMASEDCRYLGFVDADGAAGPDAFLEVLEAALAESRDCMVVASRYASGSRSRRRWNRLLMSRVFCWVIRFRYRIDIQDTQCGCKVVPLSLFRKVAPDLTEDRYGLDIELLLAARRLGVPVREIGIRWEERPGSKLGMRSALRLLRSVLLKRIGR